MSILPAKENTLPSQKPLERIWELDFVRGLCVLMMVCDHLLYDLGFIFINDWFPDGEGGVIFVICSFARYVYWQHPIRLVLRAFALIGFIGICGISCSFSRSNLKRGLKLLGLALLITAGTALMDYITGEQRYLISFGILHMLSLSILLYAALSRLGNIPCLVIGLIIIALGWILGPGITDSDNFILFALGLTENGFSADLFNVIPYSGWFLVGASLGAIIYRQKKSLLPGRGKARFFRPFYWLGNHALLVYILHQPLIFALLFALGAIFA